MTAVATLVEQHVWDSVRDLDLDKMTPRHIQLVLEQAVDRAVAESRSTSAQTA